MFVNFNEACLDEPYRKLLVTVPKDYPCRKCDMPKSILNNSNYYDDYYDEICMSCIEYKEWRKCNG